MVKHFLRRLDYIRMYRHLNKSQKLLNKALVIMEKENNLSDIGVATLGPISGDCHRLLNKISNNLMARAHYDDVKNNSGV